MRPHHAKKNELKPWLRTQWVIPPKANAESVCAVEDVLEVYTRPYDPLRPQVCLLTERLGPKHGSWLDMAEIELSALATQCLDRRIADAETLAGEVAAWQVRRNADGSAVDWRFKTEDARIKLKRLYPSIQPS